MSQPKSSLGQHLLALKNQGRKLLVPFVMCYDGGPDKTIEQAVLMASQGADVLEVGIPYSDPVADGPTIQAAAARAFAAGFTMKKGIELIKKLSQEVPVPLVAMTYVPPMYKKGEEKFLKDLAGAGIKGTIVSDLPVEASEDYRRVAASLDLATIFLTTPNTARERQALVARHSEGFVYAVSTTGITGARASMDKRLGPFLKSLKSLTQTPVLVGFGISKKEHAQLVRPLADGVIVASALIDRREDPKAQKALLKGLREGLDGR